MRKNYWLNVVGVILIIIIMLEICFSLGFLILWPHFTNFVKATVPTGLGLAACLLSLPAAIKITLMQTAKKKDKKSKTSFTVDNQECSDELKRVKIEQTITFDPCPSHHLHHKTRSKDSLDPAKMKQKKEANAKAFLTVILSISCIGHLIALIALIVCMGMMNNIGQSFARHMKKYRTDVDKKVVVDEIQLDLQCCGLDDFKDWFTIDWTGSAVVLQKEMGEVTTETVPENGTTTPGVTSECLDEGIRWDTVPFSCCRLEVHEPCIHKDLDQLGPSTISIPGCRNDIRSRMMLVFLVQAFLHMVILSFLFIVCCPLLSYKKISEKIAAEAQHRSYLKKSAFTQFSKSRGSSSRRSSLPDDCYLPSEEEPCAEYKTVHEKHEKHKSKHKIKCPSPKHSEPSVHPKHSTPCPPKHSVTCPPKHSAICPPKQKESCKISSSCIPMKKKPPQVIKSTKKNSMATTTGSTVRSEDSCMIITTDTSIQNICKPCDSVHKKKKSSSASTKKTSSNCSKKSTPKIKKCKHKINKLECPKCSKCKSSKKKKENYEECVLKCKQKYCKPTSDSTDTTTETRPVWMRYANTYTGSSQTAELQPSSHEEHIVPKRFSRSDRKHSG